MSKCDCVNTANSCDMREGCQVQARIAKSINEQQDKANQRLCTNVALEEENAGLRETIDKLARVLSELTVYAEKNIPTFSHIYDVTVIKELLKTVKGVNDGV